jgi:hypothetical protein
MTVEQTNKRENKAIRKSKGEGDNDTNRIKDRKNDFIHLL